MKKQVTALSIRKDGVGVERTPNEAAIICDPDNRTVDTPLFQVIRFTCTDAYVTESGQPVGCYTIIEKALTWHQLAAFMGQLTQQHREYAA